MALYPDYVTVDQLKAHLRVSDTDDDAGLGVAITAASRAIDKACNRQFGLAASAVARVFTYAGQYADGRVAVPIFDLQTTTGLLVAYDSAGDYSYGEPLTFGTDFDLYPRNADQDGIPWTHLVFRGDSTWFPTDAPDSLRVTARWGWTNVPTVVQQACLLQAARFFVRRDSPYGVSGSPEVGSEMRLLERLDPDVAVALASVRRWWGAVS